MRKKLKNLVIISIIVLYHTLALEAQSNPYLYSVSPYLYYRMFDSTKNLKNGAEAGLCVGKHLDDTLYIQSGIGVLPAMANNESEKTSAALSMMTYNAEMIWTLITIPDKAHTQIGFITGVTGLFSNKYATTLHCGACVVFWPHQELSTRFEFKRSTDWQVGLSFEKKIFMEDFTKPKTEQPKPPTIANAPSQPEPASIPAYNKLNLYPAEEGLYKVIVGTYINKKFAQKLQKELAQKNIISYLKSIENPGILYRVQAGAFMNYHYALQYQQWLKAQHIDSIILK